MAQPELRKPKSVSKGLRRLVQDQLARASLIGHPDSKTQGPITRCHVNIFELTGTCIGFRQSRRVCSHLLAALAFKMDKEGKLNNSTQSVIVCQADARIPRLVLPLILFVQSL